MDAMHTSSPLSHNLQSDKETFNDDDLTVDALLKCSQIHCKRSDRGNCVSKSVHRIFQTQQSVYAPDGVRKKNQTTALK